MKMAMKIRIVDRAVNVIKNQCPDHVVVHVVAIVRADEVEADRNVLVLVVTIEAVAQIDDSHVLEALVHVLNRDLESVPTNQSHHILLLLQQKLMVIKRIATRQLTKILKRTENHLKRMTK